MIKKKPTFKLKTLKSFIFCSPHWQTRQFQVSTPRFWFYCPSTRTLSAEHTLCHSSGISEIPFEPSLPMSKLIKWVLVVWGLGYKSCIRLTVRSKNWGKKKPMAIKKSMRFFTIRAYYLYPKPFKRSLLAVTMTILWPAILASRRLANCWPKSYNPLPRRQGLRERLWRLLSLQSSLLQALQWFLIVACTNAPMERLFDGLCDRSTGINWLEGRQLRLYSSHHWLTHKDGPLQTGQDYPDYTQACRSHHRRSTTSPRALKLNCHQ